MKSFFILKQLNTFFWAFALILFMAAPGIYAEPGVTDREVKIGSSLALEGHAAYLGRQALHAAQAFIQDINRLGGVHGRKIRLTAYDDAYDPALCEKNTKKLIHDDQVFALFNYIGTPTSLKILPLVQQAEIPLVGIISGAEKLRNPLHPYVFNIRASYYDETAGIITYFGEKLNLKKISVLYQNDNFGTSGLEGVKRALEKYDAQPASVGVYERGSSDITRPLEEIRKASPDAVVMIGLYSPCANFIRSAKWSGFSPYFHGISFVGAKQLAHLLGSGRDSEGVIVTQVVPPPESDIAAAKEYRHLLKKHFPDDVPGFIGFEGFINAKVLVEILKLSGKELTRKKFVKAAETLNYDPGLGNQVHFSPTNHSGMDAVYYTVIRNGRYHLIKK